MSESTNIKTAAAAATNSFTVVGGILRKSVTERYKFIWQTSESYPKAARLREIVSFAVILVDRTSFCGPFSPNRFVSDEQKKE